MKCIITLCLVILNYGVVHSHQLNEEIINQTFTKNYFENVIESLPEDLKVKIDLSDDDSVIEAGITMEEFLTKHNYTYESHSVTTDDGYILSLDRITGSPVDLVQATKKPPVLVMHGLTSSSVDWVLIGPGRSLPLLLADAGYDVWLGNNRGNTWSRKHVSLDPDTNSSFWDFSFHDLGVHDLPAFIDHILDKTGEEKLSYVGHSQGCTQFFVLTSTLPEYNDKISVGALLAPPAYMANISQPLLQAIKEQFGLLEAAAETLGIHELGQHFKFYNELSENLCNLPFYMPICLFPIELINGLDFLQVDTEVFPSFLLSYPSSISVKQLFHYAQAISSGYFRQYDYGIVTNLERYSQIEPPEYDLTQITARVGLFYALNDVLVADVDKLSSVLPNVAIVHEVSDKLFTHLDFIIAREVDKLLNVHVLEFFDQYNGQ